MADLTKREKMERQDPLVQLLALDFGDNVRRLRTAKGWTQNMLAYTLGTEHPRISNIENGLVNVRLSDIIDFARIFEVDPEELMSLSEHRLADHPAPPLNGHARP